MRDENVELRNAVGDDELQSYQLTLNDERGRRCQDVRE